MSLKANRVSVCWYIVPRESTLNFYKEAGYNCTDKTAFIQWL